MTTEAQVPPPEGLRHIQEDFGAAVRTPIGFESGRFEFRKELYPPAVLEEMAPRNNLTGGERLAMYNEQYWFRLLALMREDFPLLDRALGAWEFNQLACAYLTEYPSREAFLHTLGNRFREFLQDQPRWNSPRNLQIADLDFALLKAFYEPGAKRLQLQAGDAARLESLTRTPLRLQPWLSLLEEDWNLMENRFSAAGKNPPEFRERKGLWSVFRDGLEVKTRPLNPIPFRLLRQLQAENTLDQACEAVAAELNEQELPAFAASLAGWFKEWADLGWFAEPGSGLATGTLDTPTR
jgi:hypothetical protein